MPIKALPLHNPVPSLVVGSLSVVPLHVQWQSSSSVNSVVKVESSVGQAYIDETGNQVTKTYESIELDPADDPRYDLSRATVRVEGSPSYDGGPKTPKLTVTLDGAQLYERWDYTVAWENNVAAGTAQLTVNGTGDYHGAKRASFTIAPCSVAGITDIVFPEVTYTGSPLTPQPTIVDRMSWWNGTHYESKNYTMRAGKDYTITYANNVHAGKGTATIRGKGNYGGSKTTRFYIRMARNGIAVKTVTREVLASKVKRGA